MTESERYRFGRADCGNFDVAAHKEWLVTNGLGGFASGTVSGANTRRYHGLLVAALRPPLERTVLVSKIDAVAHYGAGVFPLSANVFAGNLVTPHGYQHLESFHLEQATLVWVYALAEAQLERRIWMKPGHNTTYLTYTLRRASEPVSLTLTPLCTYRDYHSLTQGGWWPDIRAIAGGFEVQAFAGAQPYRVVADRGEFQREPDWYWRFHYPMESYRGLDDSEDLLAPGHFRATLQPGETLTLICSTEPVDPHSSAEARRQLDEYYPHLLQRLPTDSPPWIKQLALAADQFIVRRPLADDPEGQSVIAGYPWFGDWGRDTMIALPGLTLSTGRPDVARPILKTFARFTKQGMLPNLFPDAGQTPEYNTVDATLWYFEAVRAYHTATGDDDFLRELFPTLQEIIAWHQRGTRYNIHIDPADGLLYAGEAGVQLTWMDAKVGDWVVTPRIGKPVEVNALWHNALRVMADFSKRLGKSKVAGQYRKQADFMADNFRRRFWFEAGGYLYDVIDGPEGDLGPDERRYDSSLRPNQIFAVSLPFKLLTDKQAKAVVDICARRLWTSHGLRSLDVDHPAYRSHYGGGPQQRDGAYHQGTVWSWLLGPFTTAHYRVYGDAALARSFLTAVQDHLSDACLGSISEIFDGDPPHMPRGAFAQAWSVAEVLRAWHEIGP